MFSRDGTRQEIVGILSAGYWDNPKSCRGIYAVYVSIYQVSGMNGYASPTGEVDF